MKHIIIFVTLLFLSHLICASEQYFPQGMEWKIKVEELCDEETTYSIQTIRVGKDTVIDNLLYTMIDDIPVRESGGKIYCYVKDWTDNYIEHILYDFNLKAGDSIVNKLSEDVWISRVTTIDTVILSDGRQARRLQYDNRDTDIEFIGNIVHGFFRPLYLVVLPCGSKKFLCCSVNKEPLYEAYPNACKDIDDSHTHAYYPMLQVGKTWEVHGATVDMYLNTASPFKNYISIVKDTTIDGQQYYVFNDGTCMREDIQKQEVYLFDKNKSQDYLFYKFDVNVGDTLKNVYTPNEPMCQNFYYIVDSLSLLNAHKLIHLRAIPLCSEGDDYYRNESLKEIWLEGVGNINNPKYRGPYYRSYWNLNIVGVSYWSMLMSVYTDEEFFYHIKNSPLHTLRPFPDTWYCINERRWAVIAPPDGDDFISARMETYRLSGDTVINDKSYKKLVSEHETEDGGQRITDMGGIRFNNDTSKIYFHPWNYTSTDDYLLYDYTINIGDTVNAFFRGVDDWYRQELDYIDSVVMPMVCKDIEIKNGHFYYTMECEFSKDSEIKRTFYWIEGVGTEYGLFANANTISPLEERISDHPLICATKEGTPLFHRPDEELKHIGRNGVKNYCFSFEEINTALEKIDGVIRLVVSENKLQVENSDIVINAISIYDLQGRELLKSDLPYIDISPLSSGVYVVTAETNDGNVLQSKFVRL